jgi:hypothetical protein
MNVRRSTRLLRGALIALPLGWVLAACGSMDKLNPFAEKETPLPGARKSVFPEGVPGVEFGAPPPQPSNANIPIPSTFGREENPEQPSPTTPRPAQSARTQPVQQPAPAQQPPAPAAKSAKSKAPSDPDDAWSGAR